MIINLELYLAIRMIRIYNTIDLYKEKKKKKKKKKKKNELFLIFRLLVCLFLCSLN